MNYRTRSSLRVNNTVEEGGFQVGDFFKLGVVFSLGLGPIQKDEQIKLNIIKVASIL